MNKPVVLNLLNKATLLRLLKKANRRVEKLESVIKVIYTWATFDNGNPLVPKHVINLIDKYDRT